MGVQFAIFRISAIVFTYVEISALTGGSTAACERLPDAPAVYAFFRRLQVQGNTDAETFLATITGAVKQPAAPTKTSRIGPLHRVSLESWSTMSDNKQQRLRDLASDPAFRHFLSKILATSSLLQAPLYVGKADSLQNRVRQHLEPMSDLALRLREAGISISDSILAYVVVDDPPFPLAEDALFLIEELITRICRPGFVSRIG